MYSNSSPVALSKTAFTISVKAWRGNWLAAAFLGDTQQFTIAAAVHKALAMLDTEFIDHVLDLVEYARGVLL